MKKMIKYLVLGCAFALLVAGCAKPPEAEKTAAQAVIDSAIQEGANIYGKDELKALQDAMTMALDEEKAQEGKLFKKYDKEKEILAKLTADGEALKAAIPARKEQAKKGAIAALEAAKAAMEQAKALLAKAPKGKGTKADIDAFTADLKGAEEALPAVQQAIDGEDFFGAADKAKAISDKAAGVASQIQAAMEKKGKKK